MAVTMANYPMISLSFKLGEVSNGVCFDQTINVLALLQGHIPASARRNFGQQRTTAIDLYDQAFSASNQRTDLALDLILYRYAADIFAR